MEPRNTPANPIDIDLIQKIVGDQKPGRVSRAEAIRLYRSEGKQLYPLLMEQLTFQRWKADEAEELWRGILEHKRMLRRQLGRNPGVFVAALDYLTNVRKVLKQPAIMSRETAETIVISAVADDLTGLMDRRAGHVRLGKIKQTCQERGKPFSVIMLDLDHFKELNDSYGHETGDRVLKHFADQMRSVVRRSDLVSRFGGEEFLMVIDECSITGAQKVLERLQENLKQARFQPAYTFSAGIIAYPEFSLSNKKLLRCADAALYAAKHGGRNRFEVFEPGHLDLIDNIG